MEVQKLSPSSSLYLVLTLSIIIQPGLLQKHDLLYKYNVPLTIHGQYMKKPQSYLKKTKHFYINMGHIKFLCIK